VKNPQGKNEKKDLVSVEIMNQDRRLAYEWL